MLMALLVIALCPFFLIELFYVIIAGLIEAHKNEKSEQEQIAYRPETNEEESKRIDYWGMDDDWNKWGKL